MSSSIAAAALTAPFSYAFHIGLTSGMLHISSQASLVGVHLPLHDLLLVRHVVLVVTLWCGSAQPCSSHTGRREHRNHHPPHHHHLLCLVIAPPLPLPPCHCPSPSPASPYPACCATSPPSRPCSTGVSPPPSLSCQPLPVLSSPTSAPPPVPSTPLSAAPHSAPPPLPTPSPRPPPSTWCPPTSPPPSQPADPEIEGYKTRLTVERRIYSALSSLPKFKDNPTLKAVAPPHGRRCDGCSSRRSGMMTRSRS